MLEQIQGIPWGIICLCQSGLFRMTFVMGGISRGGSWHQPKDKDWLNGYKKKQDLYICCLQETHLKTRDTYRLKVKGWKKIFHTNGDQKKAGVAILISDKIDFKIKAVKRDKEGCYIMIKGSIQEEDITIINIYARNIGAPQYVWQMLTSMKGEINKNTIIWRRKWQPTPVFLPGKVHGQRSLAGCSPWGYMTEHVCMRVEGHGLVAINW